MSGLSEEFQAEMERIACEMYERLPPDYVFSLAVGNTKTAQVTMIGHVGFETAAMLTQVIHEIRKQIAESN